MSFAFKACAYASAYARVYAIVNIYLFSFFRFSYSDELLPLQQHSISANMRLAIDRGPAPSLLKISVQFLVFIDGRKQEGGEWHI